MSTTNSNWKFLAIVMIILALFFAITTAVIAAAEINVTNDRNTLQTNYNSLKTLDDQKLSDLNNQITSLNSQVATLNAQVTTLTAANVTAYVTYTITPSSCSLFCLIKYDGSGTVNTVAFANLGTATATNAQLTVTFLGTNNTPLCSVIIVLATTMNGRTVSALTPNKSCDTGPFPTSANNVKTTITWS